MLKENLLGYFSIIFFYSQDLGLYYKFQCHMRLMQMRFVIYIDVTYEWFAIGWSTESMIRDLKLKHNINSF